MASKKGLGNVNALLPIVALAGVGFLAWVALGKPTSIESAKTGLLNFFHPQTAQANFGYWGGYHPHWGGYHRWGGYRPWYGGGYWGGYRPWGGYYPPYYPRWGAPGWGWHPHFGGWGGGYGGHEWREHHGHDFDHDGDRH